MGWTTSRWWNAFTFTGWSRLACRPSTSTAIDCVGVWWSQRIALAAFASCGEQGAVPLPLPGRARLPLPSIHDPTAETFTFASQHNIASLFCRRTQHPRRPFCCLHPRRPSCCLHPRRPSCCLHPHAISATRSLRTLQSLSPLAS